MTDRDAIRSFYEALYGEEGIDEENNLVLWTPGKVSNDWCRSLPEAVERTAKRADRSDAYFVACLQSPEAMREEAARREEDADIGRRRGYSQSASLLPALWLDLDYGREGHEKKNLPPTERHAQLIVDGMPAPPSIVIRTGGGLHAWWLLLDPLELNTDADRKRARALTYGWSMIAKGLCAERGWAMDSVYDLARVMRVPGTLNRKKEYGKEGRPVRVLKLDADIRHDVDGLEVFLPTDAEPPRMSSETVTLDGYKFSLDPNAEPPVDKLMGLCDLEADFKRTWERQRDKDLPSQSEYDLALATRAAGVGWSDQEIVNLLIAHRRKHRQPEKLRHDYYAARLALVRQQAPDISDGLEQLTEIGTEISAGVNIPDDRRNEIKDHMSNLMALPVGSEIERIEKYPGDPPTYALLTAKGRITLGTVACITNAQQFRNAVASATGHLISRFKGVAWDKVAQAVLHAAETVDLGDEVSVDGEVGAWLMSYLEDEPPDVGIVEGCESRVPFNHSGAVLIFLQAFRSFLRMNLDIRVDPRDLALRMRQAGVRRRRVSYREAGKVSSRSVYEVPLDIVREVRGVPADEELPDLQEGA